MVSMKERSLARAIERFCFADHLMAFVSGPRQCGKTTLGRLLLARRAVGEYHNWDEIEFRRAWAKTPLAVLPELRGRAIPLVVLDEIHKDRLWKRRLKGVYDTRSHEFDILVTGSARLNIYRRGSDSLLGRHLHFRLHPFTLREMARADVFEPDDAIGALFTRGQKAHRADEEHLSALLEYGPFPAPLFAHDARKARLWRQNREDLVIREDLRDLTRIQDLGRIEMLTALLPERVGSLLSVASLREDLECSFDSIRRWLTFLKELYYLFEIKPYSKKIHRSLKREGKLYLTDWGVVRDPGARFENLVASHLMKTCHFWTDTGEGEFELFYLRNKEKQEIDFLIVRDKIPWLAIEVKSTDTSPSPHWSKFLSMLGLDRGIQIVRNPAWKLHEIGASKILVIGAAEALLCLA
jgi:uncharacterized protein